MKKVFIDGSAGTTGLRIRERMASRSDLECLVLADSVRKDPAARREALNAADVAFLCLPDAAAIEAVAMVENPSTVVIDTSTAHRCAEGWTYGFPELTGQRGRIAASKRIANPGCHASGFVSLVAPLVEKGLLPSDARLSAFSLTGYSGGGKKMIAEYEEAKAKGEGEQGSLHPLSTIHYPLSTIHYPLSTIHYPLSIILYQGGRQYALGQTHKHLPEMARYCGLSHAPVFSPIVVPHLSGMEVTVPLFADQVKGGLEAVKGCYREYYGEAVERTGGRGKDSASTGVGLVRYSETIDEGGFVSSAALSGRDDLVVSAYGNDERLILVSLFDNLGKGASGAAIQNMNIALGVPERTGLECGQ